MLLFGGRVHNGFSSIFLCLYFHSKCPPNNRENVVHGRRQIAEVKVKVILFPFRVDDVSVSVISTGAPPRNVGDASVRRVVELSGTGYPLSLIRTLPFADRRHSHWLRFRTVPSGHSRLLYSRLSIQKKLHYYYYSNNKYHSRFPNFSFNVMIFKLT